MTSTRRDLFLLLTIWLATAALPAQTLVFEAEHFTAVTTDSLRNWTVVSQGPAAATASGGRYLQLLPDTRITHDDPLVPGENFCPEPGFLAVVHYDVHVPAPGRYYVWASAFSTGTEDNGVHVGLNGEWPASGKRMQWAEHEGRWKWQSKQRTEAVHSGVPRQLYLDVPTAGRHRVSFAMREDGFRMDRWALTRAYRTPAALPDYTRAAWETAGRADVLDYFTDYQYGQLPAREMLQPGFRVHEAGTPVFAGLGIRRQVSIDLEAADGHRRTVDLLVYYPAKVSGPVPTLLNLNFLGNQALVPDPEVRITRHPVHTGNPASKGIVDRRPTDANRGNRQRRLPLSALLAAGYAVVTAGYQDFLPDEATTARTTLKNFYGLPEDRSGAIAAWARAYHWLADYARREEAFTVGHLAAVGHSRLGKAVLWAAATDPAAIDAVHVNDSGCGGAALFSRARGETIADITKNFPHWFIPAFATRAGQDSLLPYDQHHLLATVAPRPLLVSSAAADDWADPPGEFAALRAALPIYRLYDGSATLPATFPTAVAGHAYGRGPLAYHLRPGKHDLLEGDWMAFLGFLGRE